MDDRLAAIRQEKLDSSRKFYGHSFINVDMLSDLKISEYKPVEGDNFIAIVPPKNTKTYIGKKLFTHGNIGVNNSAYLCNNVMFGERCPICDEFQKLAKEETAWDDMKNFKWGVRYMFLVIDMHDDTTVAKGLQLYVAPKTVNDELLTLSEDRRTGAYIDIADPITGKTVMFKRTGMKKENTKYSGFSLEDRESIPAAILEAVPDWDILLNKADYDEVYKDFYGSKAPAAEIEKPQAERPKTEQPEKEQPEKEASATPVRKPRQPRGEATIVAPRQSEPAGPAPAQAGEMAAPGRFSSLRDRLSAAKLQTKE